MTHQLPISIKIIHEPDSIDAPYVAYIPEFDVSSCGKTELEAERQVREVLQITLEEIAKKGDISVFLAESGYGDASPRVIHSTFSLAF